MRLFKMQDIMTAALGGASAGFVIAAIPYTPIWKAIEIVHARAYAIEGFVFTVGRVIPAPVLRLITSPAGIAVFFMFLGSLFAIPALRLGGKKKSSHREIFGRGAASAWAVFCFLFIAASGKTLFFYPLSAFLSLQGLLFLAAAALLSAGAGRLLNLLIQSARRAGPALVLAPALAALLFLLPVGASRDAAPGRAGKVLLVGIDAASWNALLPLIDEGRLPHFRSLMEEGSYGTLRSFLPIRSPLIWTTIATGKRPAEHGITDFTYPSPVTGELLPVSLGLRTVSALWDIAGKESLSIGIVNWYGSWPAEETNGVFVSSRIGVRGTPLRAYPPERLNEFENLVPDEVFLKSDAAGRLAVRVWEHDRPDLLMAFFVRLDNLQHRFWKYHGLARGEALSRLLHPGIPDNEISAFGNIISSEYVLLDAILGRLLQTADDDTVVIVVSDHGMGTARGFPAFQFERMLEHLGWLSYEPGTEHIDWTATKLYDGTVYGVPRSEPRTFLLNMRPEGPFGGDPAAPESRAFLDEALNVLDSLRTASGRRVITKIRLEGLPASSNERILVWIDHGIAPKDAVVFKNVSIPSGRLFLNQELSGMHRLEGVFIAWGPGIRKGYRIKDASVMDIVPTALHLLGLPAARDMGGRILTGMFAPGVPSSRPLKRIPTYQPDGPRKPRIPEKTGADEKILEELRTLGYIR